MAYEKYHATLLDCSKIRPFTKELVDRCGSSTAAAEYAMVGHTTILRILNRVNCSIQRATAAKILIALDHKRIEDRKVHRIHENLRKARQAQVRSEDLMERLAGY